MTVSKVIFPKLEVGSMCSAWVWKEIVHIRRIYKGVVTFRCLSVKWTCAEAFFSHVMGECCAYHRSLLRNLFRGRFCHKKEAFQKILDWVVTGF